MTHGTSDVQGRTYKTTNKMAIAPPFPIKTAAAAGAAKPALV